MIVFSDKLFSMGQPFLVLVVAFRGNTIASNVKYTVRPLQNDSYQSFVLPASITLNTKQTYFTCSKFTKYWR